MRQKARLINHLIRHTKQRTLYPVSALTNFSSTHLLTFHQHDDALNKIHSALVHLITEKPEDSDYYHREIATHASLLCQAVMASTPNALTEQKKQLERIKSDIDKLLLEAPSPIPSCVIL
jgi:hypothetical protein